MATGRIPIHLQLDKQSPIPIRRQLTEQLKHLIEAGRVSADQRLPSIRELAGFLRINPNTVARVVEDLKRSAHVEVRRGKGVFVAPAPPLRRLPIRRRNFLEEVVIRAAALGMTVDDVSVGLLSLIGHGPIAVQGTVGVLLVECSRPELDFFAGALEEQLPVRVDKVLLRDMASAVRATPGGRWRAAVTSFCHLPAVERRLRGMGIPVIALLAEAHLETLQRLAHLRPGTRVGIVSAAVESAHNIRHSIANAGLPNIAIMGTSPPVSPALTRLVRRVDAVVCPSAAADQVRAVAGSAVQVIIDDRALDARAIEMLATVFVEQNGARATGDARPPRKLRRTKA